MIDAGILKTFRARKVLVTGGTGLIGRQVLDILSEAGADVTSVSLDHLEVRSGVRFIYGDLTDFTFCRKITAGVEFVIHLAGIKGSIEVTKTRPASFFVPLLMMNTNMLEACRLSEVRKTVYTSSIGAYSSAEVFVESQDSEGPPMDLYPGWAKRMAELQIQAYRIQYGTTSFSIVRPCNVYGPGDNFDPETAMVIPSLMARIRRGEDPLRVWGDGSAVRDFAYSRDVAEGVILALHHGTDSKPVNLGSGRGFSVRELVLALQGIVPFKAVFDASKPSGFPKRVMDISLARTVLGYHPTTSLDEGLRMTWEWYLAHSDEHEKKLNYLRK
jgi:GDP-L-fucose synthase